MVVVFRKLLKFSETGSIETRLPASQHIIQTGIGINENFLVDFARNRVLVDKKSAKYLSEDMKNYNLFRKCPMTSSVKILYKAPLGSRPQLMLQSCFIANQLEFF